MLDQTSERDQTGDIEVTIAAAHEDPAFIEMMEDRARNEAAITGEELEEMARQQAPERRTRPEYKAADENTILGTIHVSTTAPFLALIESTYNRPAADCVTVNRVTGDVTPARKLGPEDARDLGNAIADHLGSPVNATIEVEQAGEFFRPIAVYSFGRCALALCVSESAAREYASMVLRSDRLTVPARPTTAADVDAFYVGTELATAAV